MSLQSAGAAVWLITGWRCDLLYCTVLYCTVLGGGVTSCTVLYCTVLGGGVTSCQEPAAGALPVTSPALPRLGINHPTAEKVAGY